jgi:hypothetical protein
MTTVQQVMTVLKTAAETEPEGFTVDLKAA